ncbi:MAG TPA: hypothetical protein VM406_12210 [Noviherbaspirillum sp.]|nr:hypothetical protein [Noviherbaspirillum sp.]
MTEVFTREPETVIKTLQDAGLCRAQAPARETADCPAAQSCLLADGAQLCVQGVQTAGTAVPAAPAANEAREITGMEVVSVAAVFIAGIALGRYWPRSRSR